MRGRTSGGWRDEWAGRMGAQVWRWALALVALVLVAVGLSACVYTSTPEAPASARAEARLPLRVPEGAATGAHLRIPGAVAPPHARAAAVYLINPDTGTIYLATNADTPLAMASTTKIMTALVALSVGKLDTSITVPAEAIGLADGQASSADLKAGETLTLRELLYGLLLPSGDDAAVAIADGVAGSQDQFVALMNAEAALLGLWHTHYSNVHGLDAPEHYSTARDLARLATIAMRSPTFAGIVATAEYTVPQTDAHRAHDWRTTNELLTDFFYSGVNGVKTGFTGNAGRCLVFSATRPYGKLIGVLLGEPDSAARFTDARALLDWGFSLEQQGVVPAAP